MWARVRTAPWLNRLDGIAAVLRKETQAQRRQLRVWWRSLLRAAFFLVFVYWISFIANFDFNPDVMGDYGFPQVCGALFLLLLGQIIPATGDGIAREREQGSLDLLLLTKLSPWEILLGKLLAPLVPLARVVVPAIIAVCLVQLLQGYGIGTILLGILLATLGALAIGALGLWCSTWFSTPARAIGATLVATALVLMPFVLEFVESQFFYYTPLDAETYIRALLTVVLAAVASLLTRIIVRHTLGWPMPPFLQIAALLPYGFAGWFLLDTPVMRGFLYYDLPHDTVLIGIFFTATLGLCTLAARRLAYYRRYHDWAIFASRDVDPGTPLVTRDGFTAVLRKERLVLRRQLGVWRWVVPAAFVLLPALIVLGLVQSSQYSGYLIIFICFCALIIVMPLLLLVFNVLTTTGAFAHERETGAWEMLLLTRLTTAELVFGKVLTVGWPNILVSGVLLIAAPCSLLWDSSNWVLLLYFALSFFLAALLYIGTSLYCSSLFAKTATARIATFTAGGLVILGHMSFFFQDFFKMLPWPLSYSDAAHWFPTVMVAPVISLVIREHAMALYYRMTQRNLPHFASGIVLAVPLYLCIQCWLWVMSQPERDYTASINPHLVIPLWLFAILALFWLTIRRVERLRWAR